MVIANLRLPFMYGPTTSTFTRFHGIVSASFGGEVGHIAYVASCSFGIYRRCDSVLLLFRKDLANRIRGELSLPCASFLGVVTANGSCRLSYLVVSLVL